MSDETTNLADPIGNALMAMDDTARKFSQQAPEWASAIGRFLVAFASCEQWIRQFTFTFGSRNVAAAVDGASIRTRCDVASALVRDLWLVADVQAKSDAVFAQVRALADERNLVAHNPPRWYIESEVDEPKISFQIRHPTKPGRRVDLADVRALHAKTAQLTHELANVFQAVGSVQNRVKTPVS